jgi:hypothetical protein
MVPIAEVRDVLVARKFADPRLVGDVPERVIVGDSLDVIGPRRCPLPGRVGPDIDNRRGRPGRRRLRNAFTQRAPGLRIELSPRHFSGWADERLLRRRCRHLRQIRGCTSTTGEEKDNNWKCQAECRVLSHEAGRFRKAQRTVKTGLAVTPIAIVDSLTNAYRVSANGVQEIILTKRDRALNGACLGRFIDRHADTHRAPIATSFCRNRATTLAEGRRAIRNC